MDEKIMEAGMTIASLWGAKCMDYEVNREKEKVTFFCMEDGEEFAVETTFAELNAKHGIEI